MADALEVVAAEEVVSLVDEKSDDSESLEKVVGDWPGMF